MEHANGSFISQTLARARQLRSRAARGASALHYVEGFRAFLQLIDARIPIETIIYCEILAQNPVVQKQVRLLRRAGTLVTRVSPAQFRSVSCTERASGIGVIARQHWTPLDQANPARGLCWVAVSLLRSPGNLGTVIRTAEAVGVGGAVFLGDASDPFDPNVVRASMGGLFRLQLARASIDQFAAWSCRHGCTVIGTSPSGSVLYTEVPLNPPLVVLFGEERAGMSPAEKGVCTHMARVPITGHADSLNVGVAAGVTLYEVLRRGELARTATSE